MAAQLTIDIAQKLALSKGGYCLSDFYLNSTTHLIWKCAKGHMWSAAVTNIRNNNHWCPKCAGKAKGTIEEMQELAIQRGGKCLSETYTNRYTKLTWQCAKRHIWKSSPTHIKSSNSWCPVCAGTKKLTIEEMRILASQKGGRCLSPQYVNQRVLLEWECKEGHRWLARPASIRNSNVWCPECSGKKKGTIEEMRQIAETRGGKCLSSEYKNKDIKLEWQCAKGHAWWARSGDIKRGHWCGECCRGFGEKICRAYFESIFGRKFPNLKQKW